MARTEDETERGCDVRLSSIMVAARVLLEIQPPHLAAASLEQAFGWDRAFLALVHLQGRPAAVAAGCCLARLDVVGAGEGATE